MGVQKRPTLFFFLAGVNFQICQPGRDWVDNEDDAYIDNNWKYTNDRHFLKDADLFFKYKD